MKFCSINGQQQELISVSDRGLAYGDGLFTTAKVVDGQISMLNQHIERLVTGCLQLDINLTDIDGLIEYLITVARRYTLAVLKVVVTSGSGGRGYSRANVMNNAANIIVMVFDFPHHLLSQYETGIELGVSKQQMAMSPMLAGLKHLNRLEQVLLRAELDKRTEDDLLVTNVAGHVIESTCANLFYFMNNKLYTPEVDISGVNGLMRQRILAQMTQSTIKLVSLEQLEHAEAMFICNSVMGIMPVKKYNGRDLSISAVTRLRKVISA